MQRQTEPVGNQNEGAFLTTLLLICGLDVIRKSCGPYGPLISGALGCVLVIVVIVLIIVFSTQSMSSQSSNSSSVTHSGHSGHNNPYAHWWYVGDWWWIIVVVAVLGLGTPFLFWPQQRVVYVRQATNASNASKTAAAPTATIAPPDGPLLAMRV